MTFPLPALTSKRPITGLESAPKLPTRSNALFRAVSQFFSGLRIFSILGWEFPLALPIPPNADAAALATIPA